MTSSPSSEGELPADIRHDPSWEAGFIDRFEHHQRVEVGDLLADEFTDDPQLLIIGDGGLTSTSTQTAGLLPHSIVTDRGYLTLDFTASQPRCILLGTDINTVRQVADRWNRVPSETRPLLAHPYFPSTCPVRFAEVALPRPLPILPLLISKRLYTHQPRAAQPTTNELLILLAVALANEVLVSGIDQDEIRMIRQKHERLDFNELGIDA